MSVTTTLKLKFKPDFQIAKLSALGIIGFIVGCVFLFYNDLFTIGKVDSVFHEISYQPRVYTALLVNTKIDSLNKEVIAIKASIKNLKDTDTTSATKNNRDSLNGKIKDDSISISKLAGYKKYYEDLALQDTMSFVFLNKVLHFQITPDLISKWDCHFNKLEFKKDSSEEREDTVTLCSSIKTDTIVIDTVKCYLKDAAIPFKIEGEIEINLVRPHSDIEFISKYPSVGVWLILILIFCSFCFIAIATAIHLKAKVWNIFTEEDKNALVGKYYIICLVTALVMGLMVWLWNRTFYDDDIVKNLFFMKNLSVSMRWVILLGSLTGAFCLAGFIFTASMVNYFAAPVAKVRKNIENLELDLKKLKAITSDSPEHKSAIDTKQAEIDQETTNSAEQENDFKKLTDIFQNYFLLAAITLSIMVLCTGALFSTINSLDFVKLLADDWGYSPVRNDYVYLYGALYTVILLLVYVPAKMRFREVDVWGTKSAATPENAKWYDFIKDPFGKMKDVLVATSPLLISLIQSLFDLLFK